LVDPSFSAALSLAGPSSSTGASLVDPSSSAALSLAGPSSSTGASLVDPSSSAALSLVGPSSSIAVSSADPSSSTTAYSAGPLSNSSASSCCVREKKRILYRNYNPKEAVGLAGQEHKGRWLLLRVRVTRSTYCISK
jgi:Mucin-like